MYLPSLSLLLRRLLFLCAALLALGLIAAPVQAQVPRYVKVSNSGHALPDSAALGSGSNDWACTYDRETQLIWEVKTTSGLRSQDHTYTWYDSNSTDGNPGTENGGTCETSGHCDTEKYVVDVNATNLCGANDWRMPTGNGSSPNPSDKELQSLVVTGSSPTINTDWFPNTPSSNVWSGSPRAYNPNVAWVVSFYDGDAYGNDRGSPLGVRLVRAGQPFAPLPTTASIPTLSQWGTLALAGLLGLTSLAAMRRRNPRG